MTEYTWAPDVEVVVKDIIGTVEQHHDLVHAQILCVFRDKAATSRGRLVLGRARKLGGLVAFLVDDDDERPLFVLEFAGDLWQTLNDKQRRALVDHELSHLTMEKDKYGQWVGGTRGHDLEEFLGVIDRHGLWKEDVASLGTLAAAKHSCHEKGAQP